MPTLSPLHGLLFLVPASRIVVIFRWSLCPAGLFIDVGMTGKEVYARGAEIEFRPRDQICRPGRNVIIYEWHDQ